MGTGSRTPLLGMTLDELRAVAAGLGMPPFKGGQMARWLYQRRATSIGQMTDLSKREREALEGAYGVGREAPVAVQRSADGTVKYAFPGAGGRRVESVWIPDGRRATLCVSSQAGCRMGCRFCATGMGGFQGQLTAGQIINQVLSVEGSEEITNIVFMGMGEPLDNLDAVLRAIDILTAPWGLAMSPRRITVSTVGTNAAALRRLLDDTNVDVAFSLHLPDPGRRAQLMPAEKGLAAHDVLALLAGHDWSRQRHLTVEYIVWDGVNDGPRQAAQLTRLLEGLHCRVNLIPYHETGLEGLRGAPPARLEAFRDMLNARGITCTIRTSRGLDIDAACGQLAGKK